MLLLKGELDWVILKCLEKSRERRYETASGLAKDIKRFLRDEPVEARPPSPGYRLGKFLRRNMALVSAAVAVLLALMAGVVGTSVGMFRARKAEVRATASAISANDAREKTERANRQLQESIAREAARFELARQAIGMFHGEVSQDLLLKESKFEDLRNACWKSAARFYGELETLLKSQSDHESQVALGRAYLDLGQLTDKIGDKQKALEIHQKGLAIAQNCKFRMLVNQTIHKTSCVDCTSLGNSNINSENLPKRNTRFKKGFRLAKRCKLRTQTRPTCSMD